MRQAPLASLLVLALLACGGSSSTGPDPDPTTGELIVRASGSATATLTQPALRPVDAASFEVGFVEMRISANADCSAPYQTVFTGSTPNRVDVLTNPQIARTTGLTRGTYPCVALRVSDILRYAPATTEGACVSGVVTNHDFFRAGNEPVPFRDLAGAVIPARGARGAPVEDLVWVFISTNEAAVQARGYADNQIVLLSSPLVVPGTTTFYWDLSGALGPQSGFCETVGGSIGFR
jgi:hypothetical protein